MLFKGINMINVGDTIYFYLYDEYALFDTYERHIRLQKDVVTVVTEYSFEVRSGYSFSCRKQNNACEVKSWFISKEEALAGIAYMLKKKIADAIEQTKRDVETVLGENHG